jgi:hypothetical protein
VLDLRGVELHGAAATTLHKVLRKQPALQQVLLGRKWSSPRKDMSPHPKKLRKQLPGVSLVYDRHWCRGMSSSNVGDKWNASDETCHISGIEPSAGSFHSHSSTSTSSTSSSSSMADSGADDIDSASTHSEGSSDDCDNSEDTSSSGQEDVSSSEGGEEQSSSGEKRARRKWTPCSAALGSNPRTAMLAMRRRAPPRKDSSSRRPWSSSHVACYPPRVQPLVKFMACPPPCTWL